MNILHPFIEGFPISNKCKMLISRHFVCASIELRLVFLDKLRTYTRALVFLDPTKFLFQNKLSNGRYLFSSRIPFSFCPRRKNIDLKVPAHCSTINRNKRVYIDLKAKRNLKKD